MEDRPYRELLVWRKAVDLGVACHRLTHRLPVSELHGLSAEIRRAAVCISATIAHGSGACERGSYRRKLRIARGALARLDTLLVVGQRLGYLPLEACEEIALLVDEVGRLLAVLQQSLHRPSAS